MKSIYKYVALLYITFASHTTLAANSSCESYLFTDPLTGSQKLPPNCIFKKSLQINSSNVSLDCNNSTFDGENILKIGLLIDSQGNNLNSVKIKNCKFVNFKQHGLRIGWNIPDGLKPKDKQENYSRTPTNIELENILVSNSGRSGIYIDDYVTHTNIKNTTVEKSRTAGIYLEHDSAYTSISNSKFIENGFADDFKPTREAIAIDSSPHNKITNSSFKNNATGSIFLYKNCYEHFSDPEQVPRQQEASYNLIANNSFENEKIGIHIASRQSKNLSRLECGDKPMDKDGQYYEDFSNHNSVEKNSFCNVVAPIIIEGDFNLIKDNFFEQNKENNITMPITMRETLKNQPSLGNRLINNLNLIKECGVSK